MQIVAIKLAIAGGLIAFWSFFIWTAATNYQKVKIEKIAEKNFNISLDEKQKELTEAVKKQTKWREKAIELQSKTPKVVIRYVEKIVDSNPNCNNIDGFSELFKQLSENYQSESS